MKLAIIGGAGVRTPRLIPSLIKRAERLGLQELWLMDNDAAKLDLIGGLCREMAVNAPFKIILTTDAREAINGAQHVITAIRPGLEQGRATDERICFNHGILGQETTGAAGFAMAMRSIPAILGYARLTAEIGAPGAWIYNFTNPAGLVAQALHYAGIDRIVGICDSANGAQHAVSRFMEIPLKRLHHTVYGLNHLSWTNSVRVDYDPAEGDHSGEEVLPGLLTDERFVGLTHMQMFAPGLRAWQKTFLNEYLHYFYHRDEALAALIKKPETRGEETIRLTHNLLERLQAVKGDAQASLAAYHEVMGERGRTYMAHARGGHDRVKMEPVGEDEEGYAAVALGCVEAIQNNALHYTGLNVPNKGAIAGMADDDVVEVGCWIDASGIRPIQVGIVPDHQLLLMQTVKQYERLGSRAILNQDRELAVEALTVHPLVGSYPLAEKLIDAFLTAHVDLVGAWH
ncbi:MAG TPA: hypothetical protein VHL11_05310 [Phototrophicaceae bacterium]|jgi:6-phospho-beta-glucosidase|nr:hypothetical protein [Phototrophicaceae bacterium]